MSLDDVHAQLKAIVDEARQAFESAPDENALHQVKARFLGKKGSLAALMSHMRALDPEDRPAFGAAVNEAKNQVEQALEDAKNALLQRARNASLGAAPVDLSLPPRRTPPGAVHPLRRVEREIVSIFRDLGYDVAVGPQVEHDFHNFEALNFAPDHPARDMQDTFVLEDGRLLRTHTSPVQIRAMLAHDPPIRVVAPGAVYRCDELDMTHSPAFHQVEGLVVDRGVTMAQLKGSLQRFASRLFGRDLNVRLRPSFFPFTEPSVEVDVECPFCSSGCRVCKGGRWIEILGAGMVDPAVFESVGIDPDVYTGFAFGIGVERVAMLKYGVRDIRAFYENDVRFLAQFIGS